MIWQAYSDSSYLFYHADRLESWEGVQQGDPIGPFLFSLGIQHLVEECKSEFDSWYLDDGTLGGYHVTVLNDLESILKSEDYLGLKVNPSKCELHFIDSTLNEAIIEKFQELLPNMKIIGPGKSHPTGLAIVRRRNGLCIGN